MVFQLKRRKKTLPFLIGLSISCNGVIAQEGDSPIFYEEVLEEEVVVTGVRASQAKSVDLKRNAKNVVDSIVAEDIGKLPDVTITDSLQRIPGIQIAREANEGTSLNVRGMPQVLTTLNGEQFLSPKNITSVGADFSDIPAGLISGVNVYKSQSASMIAGGISGVVDLQTLSPLSLDEGYKFSVRAEGSQGSRSDKEIQSDGSYKNRDPDHNIGLFFGYNFEGEHAFTLALTNSSSYAANYSMWQDPRFMFLEGRNGRPSDPLDLDGDDDLSNDWYLAPENMGASSKFLTRDRTGGSFSIESNLSDTVTFKSDVFYTEMDRYDRGVELTYENINSALSWNRNTEQNITENGLYDALLPSSQLGESHSFSYPTADGVQDITVHSVTVAELVSSGFQSNSTNEITNTAALNTNFQLEYDDGENIQASLRYIYAKAEERYRKVRLQQGRPGWLWIDNDGISGKDPISPFPVGVDFRGDTPRFYNNSGGVTDEAIRATGIYQDANGNDIFDYSRSVSSADLLANYQAIADDNYNKDSTLQVARGDVTYTFDSLGVMQSVDFGLRLASRKAGHDKFYYITPTQTYDEFDTRFPAELRGQYRDGNQIWQRFPDWQPFSADSALQTSDTIVFTDFGPIQGLESGVAAVNPAVWDEPLDYMNKLYYNEERDLRVRTISDPAYAYNVKENSTSLYGQINFEGEDFLGFAFSAGVGLRVVHTDREVKRNKVPEVLDLFNSIGAVDNQRLALISDPEELSASFTQVLPSVNLNLYPSEEFVVRFAANRTTSRNDLENVGAGLSLWYTECAKLDENGERVTYRDTNGADRGETVTCVGGGNDTGNIEIDPWAANVYNGSAEWYFDENAILGFGLFYIDVDSSVQRFQETRSFVDGDGIERNNRANIWVTDNVEASSLYGFELGYKQPFTFLPGILDGTGVEFNYTYSKSDSKVTDLQGNDLPLASNSAHQTNFILWYDKAGFNVRLAYNWRSEEYQSRREVDTSVGDALLLSYWAEPVGYLDLSVSYWINENISIFANGTNLTEENRKSYAQFEDQFQSLYVQEARYSLGVNLSF